MLDKAAVRARLLAARKNFAAPQRLAADSQIAALVTAQPEWQKARRVGCYLSLPEEVSTRSLIQTGLQNGKTLAAPVVTRKSEPLHFYQFTLDENLRPGPLGILQPPLDKPVAPEDLDLLIVPGVGFDRLGNRLGYGGGFFDRYLALFTGTVLGVAYALQVEEKLPLTPTDRPVHLLVTETGVLRFR
jgi:5-formyltetrahydrofolate cyclo-ligase